MLTKPITGPQAWTAATLDPPSSWYYPLADDLLAALDDSVRQLRRNPQPATSLQVGDFPCAGFRHRLEAVRAALEAGRGFAIITGLSRERYSPQELSALYWLVGQLLGRPFAQNVQGTLLYDVRDTGQDLSQGARFSVTTYESSFHTDNSFGDSILDYVGLLCLSTAKSGGISQVVSGYSAHNRLRAEHPDVLSVLYEPFHVDRRGGTRPGETPTIEVPVLAWDGRELLYRYLRYWIQAGYEKIGRPMTSQQIHALDTLDKTNASRDLIAEFMLQPGQMFFINNRWILHNRTAFEDYAELDRRRHYVRLWLQA